MATVDNGRTDAQIADYAPGVSDLGVGLEALRLSVRNAEALVSWSLLDDGGREFLSEPQKGMALAGGALQ